jgi:CheY-like chemotaxis protein
MGGYSSFLLCQDAPFRATVSWSTKNTLTEAAVQANVCRLSTRGVTLHLRERVVSMTIRPADTGRGEEPQYQKRIVVVDDDPTLVSLFSTILRRHGYETAEAYSGEEAIDVARTFQPHLILSDVVMGGMNGIDAALVILGVLPQCKVLFISGAGYLEPLENARSRGFNFELLRKPVTAIELLESIARVLQADSSQQNFPAAS